MPHPVLDAANLFRQAARRRETAVMRQLAQAYADANREIRAEVRALVEAARAQGRNLTTDEVRRMASLDVLARRTLEVVGEYARYADSVMVNAMLAEIAAAQTEQAALVATYFEHFPEVQRAVMAGWTRLPTETVETLIGMTNPASPLHSALTHRLGRAVADQMIERMVLGIAQGRNPRDIARQVMGEGLTWTMTTVRTAQLNAYRYAARENYRANRDVVSGWRWMATLDNRTCISCLVMHGTIHGVDEVLNDHHNGRCAPIPIVPRATDLGIPEVTLPSAEAWIQRKSEAVQQEIMGVGIWGEWNAGRVKWRDLTTTYLDPVYGTMRKAPTLRQVRG